MNDDIVTRLREINVRYVLKEEWFLANALTEAADEIERLRSQNTELVKMFKQVGVVAEMWQKSEDELIELHHGKCAEQFAKQADEIERLRSDRDTWKRTCTKLVGMMLPYSLLMHKTEQEELQIILGEAVRR